jgi:plasmid maintenance system antidote protein VapI
VVRAPGPGSSASSATKWGTADTALPVAAFFGSSAAFGLNRQTSYDTETARCKISKGLEKIEPLKPS